MLAAPGATAIWSGRALGFLVLFFGANGVLGFFPVAPNPPEAEKFRNALLDTRYMLPLWKSVELVSGVLLVAGLWVPLALVLLAPVLVNIFLFHLFLAPRGLPLAVALALLAIVVGLAYREALSALFVR